MLHYYSCFIRFVFLFFLMVSLTALGVAQPLSQSPNSHNPPYTKSIEVLHWWTSGGEAQALNVIRNEMVSKGFLWKDSPIVGSDGLQQKRVLRARMSEKNPPDVVLTQYVPHFARSGFLETLDDIALEDNWQALIPEPLQHSMKYNGHWMAVPVNIQRFNWVWANKKIFTTLQLQPPQTFDELIEVCKKIKQAGYIPFAHGGQAWQDEIFFESILLSVGGVSLFNKALVEFDLNVLNSEKMVTVFERVAQIREFFDKDFINRDWNLATSMIIHDKAAMQVMGDWAKGEFTKAHQLPNKEFLCFAFPDTRHIFLFATDFFGILKAPKDQNKRSQHIFVRTLFDKPVQEKFNQIKGSIPFRQDINMQHFDECSQQSKTDFNLALKKQRVVEHMDMRLQEKRRNAVYTAIANAFHDHNLSAKDAAKAFLKAAQTTQ
ncbi:MAG: ABC transporter substrate-binding protein [Pseudomonadota bacterium]